MTQLVVASTLFGATAAAAAADAGLLAGSGERVLLVVNNAPVPELTPALDEVPGAEPVLARFDRVVHLNEVIAPVVPAEWRPDARERPMLETLLRRYWQLADDELSIVSESIWASPALALARVFHAATLTVYADGLMSYGPTYRALPLDVVQRLDGLLHLDLVPGLRPAQLREYDVEPTVIPSAAFRDLIEEIAASDVFHRTAEATSLGGATGRTQGRSTALVVGQYLAALDLMTREEEAELHAHMVRAAAEAGAEIVHIKLHPWAPPGLLEPAREAARRMGVALEIIEDAIPVEVMIASGRYLALVGCFSTALATARAIFGMRTVAVGTGQLLRTLQPYANRNRLPLVLSDVMHRSASPFDGVVERQELADAMAFTMRPEQLSQWRDYVSATLAEMSSGERERYFAGARLRKLELPGAPKTRPPRK